MKSNVLKRGSVKSTCILVFVKWDLFLNLPPFSRDLFLAEVAGFEEQWPLGTLCLPSAFMDRAVL